MGQRSLSRADRTRKSSRKKVLRSVSGKDQLEIAGSGVNPIPRGGVACPFPWKLHEMLEFVHSNDMEHIVSWDEKGTAFSVNDVPVFVKSILPK